MLHNLPMSILSRRNWLTILLLAPALLHAADGLTALEQYVRSPDGSFRYQLVNTIRSGPATTYVLELVSQNWLSDAQVNQPEWRHWLILIKPERVRHSTAVLFLNAGSNDDPPPSGPDPILGLAAVETGTVVADLRMVPNQPLVFTGDGRPRSEDAVIAYSWDRYLQTGDGYWPAQLPMTKAAMRAMDATTEFLASEPGGKLSVDRYLVAGGSKRGWAAWTTAAVDPRVVAVAPLVIDLLNLEKSFLHHYRTYGFWAPAIQDYVDMNIMSWMGTSQFRELAKTVDPYEYRDILTLPKYLVNSAGDQFFVPDSSRFYFADLPGEKYLRYVPNTDHSLVTPEVVVGLFAWLDAILENRPRPRFSWTIDREKGIIRVRTLDRPLAVKVWQASNPTARDFRRMTIGPAWTSTPLEGEDGIYTAQVPSPAAGFTAFFVELTFPGRLPLVFTTEVAVVPDVYPFPPPTR